MNRRLITLLGDSPIANLERDRNGRVSLTYREPWRQAANALPLSLSMPVALAEHGHRVVDAYLWGLLPDSEMIIERWARRFHVSARNAFGLIAHVGDDCAGAVRFIEPDRLSELATGGRGTVEWLQERDVGDRLRVLRVDASAWRRETDNGQFSLAGAQPKTALLFDGRRWGVPFGRIPTTHILKPGTPGLEGHAENEHFCLSLAAELGLPVARSRVMSFDGQIAIVIERYDRVRTAHGIVRVHQEDVCQALGVHPARKYENEGGPGPSALARLLRDHSSSPDEDLDVFVQALVFNWVVGGTDAHAKNYSLLLGEEGRARLAPLYDLASALPYAGTQLQKLKLAMKIGGQYRLRDIGVHQWAKLASDLHVEADRVLEPVTRTTRAVPDLCADLMRRARVEGPDHPVVRKLATAITDRARHLAL